MMDYHMLREQVRGMIQTDSWFVPAMSNISSLLMETLPNLNWAGFYILRNGGLVVGPFQGKPACIHIPEGKGVCGTALQEDRALNVPDVHAFPGHIACDSASQSELVIPLHSDGKAVAVLDMDSPQISRFTPQDEEELKKTAEMIENLLNWDGI